MNYKDISIKHKTFTYKRFESKSTKTRLHISFYFSVSPNINFVSQVNIPLLKSLKSVKLDNLIFHLGLIEAISYWKSSCSPEFVIEAGNLTPKQVKWWYDLFTYGLGEFYYQNNIDLTDSKLLHIVSSTKKPHLKVDTYSSQLEGDLILVGGGKDSIVTLNSLTSIKKRKNVMMLNPTTAAIETAKLAGFSSPIIIHRKIDKKLLKLNDEGYLNGHTPFSAYLSFLSVMVGEIYGYNQIIASNESSAGEGNMTYHKIEINHQYSKSYRYERMFREYSQKYLSPKINYFSFLRPLYELQIAALFSTLGSSYNKVFCSCNKSRNEYWCGECAKCAFVYISLAPFLDEQKMQDIFGKENYLENSSIQKHIRDLVGLGLHKPFDCVGTKEESIMAISMTVLKYRHLGQEMPRFLKELTIQLKIKDDTNNFLLKEHLKKDWNKEHYLPKEYEKLLQEQLHSLRI